MLPLLVVTPSAQRYNDNLPSLDTSHHRPHAARHISHWHTADNLPIHIQTALAFSAHIQGLDKALAKNARHLSRIALAHLIADAVASPTDFVLYRYAYLTAHQALADSPFATDRSNTTAKFAYQKYWSTAGNQTTDKKYPNLHRRHAKSPRPLLSALAIARPIAIAA